MEDCIHLGKAFIQKLIDCLNDRFTNLHVFNAANFLVPIVTLKKKMKEILKQNNGCYTYVKILILETHQ
jgi:hypothetical protein